MAQKFSYILLDLCEFLHILKRDFFFEKKVILKTKSKKNLKKLAMYFSTGTFI